MTWDDEDTTVILSAGPARVVTDDPGPEPPRLLGFGRSLIDQQLVREVKRLRAEHGPLGLNLPETPLDPLLWEGDQA